MAGGNDPQAIVARVDAARNYYDAAGIDIAQLLRPYLDPLPQFYGPHARRDATALNTDMFPRDEFALPF